MSNGKGRDYNFVNNKKFTFNGRSYTFYDERSRSTSTYEKSPRKRGILQLRENAIHRTWVTRLGTPCQLVITNRKTGLPNLSTTFGVGPGEKNDYSMDLMRLENTALARFNKRVEQRIILGMEYIDARKSLWSYLKRLALALWDIFTAIKQRKFKSVRKYLPRQKRWGTKRVEMTAHEKWLEYHFAIAPMVEDIYNVLHAETQNRNNFGKVRVRATVNTNQVNNGRDTVYQYAYNSEYNRQFRCTITGHIKCTSAALAAGNYVGLDPSKWVWDLLPFSFVIDWFINVGQWLNALSTPGYDVSNCSTTNRRIIERTEVSWNIRPDDNQNTYSTLGGGVHRTNVTYQRFGAHPTVKVVFNNEMVDAWRSMTSIALLRSIFKN